MRATPWAAVLVLLALAGAAPAWAEGWTRSFATATGSTWEDGAFRGLDATDDEGFVFAGRSLRGGSWAAWTLRVSRWGAQTWSRAVEGAGEQALDGIVAAGDGSFVAVGSSGSSVDSGGLLLLRLASTGTLSAQWTVDLGAPARPRAIVELIGGGFVVVGELGAAPARDLFAVRLDAALTPSWAVALGGSGDDVGANVVETAGGLAVVGTTASSSPDTDLWIVDLRPDGTLAGARRYDLADDRGSGIVGDGAGGLYVSGDVDGGNGNDGIWVMHVDAAREVDWTRIWAGSGTQVGGGIDVDSAGDVVVAGTSAGNTWVGRMSAAGATLASGVMGGAGVETGERLLSVDGEDGANAVVVGSTTTHGLTAVNAWVVRLPPSLDFAATTCSIDGGGGLVASTAAPVSSEDAPAIVALDTAVSPAGLGTSVPLTSGEAVTACESVPGEVPLGGGQQVERQPLRVFQSTPGCTWEPGTLNGALVFDVAYGSGRDAMAQGDYGYVGETAQQGSFGLCFYPPAAGQLNFFLVRGINSAGPGTWGFRSDGQERFVQGQPPTPPPVAAED